ncbi:MAG: hypothetical protein H6734_00535 [Alphaproteobacteria bacterium]|nr:hypothetical protein [Alphaproteobacteria bacterium]
MGRENVVWSRGGYAEARERWNGRAADGPDALRALADGGLEEQLDAFCGVVARVPDHPGEVDVLLALGLELLDRHRVDWRRSRLLEMRVDLLQAASEGRRAAGRPFAAVWLASVAVAAGGPGPGPAAIADVLHVPTAMPPPGASTVGGLLARGHLLECLEVARRAGESGFAVALARSALTGDVAGLGATIVTPRDRALARLFAHGLPELRAPRRVPDVVGDALLDVLEADLAGVDDRLLALEGPLEQALTGGDCARGLLALGAVARLGYRARRSAIVGLTLAVLRHWSHRVSGGASDDVYRTSVDIQETVELPVLSESRPWRMGRTMSLVAELGVALGASRVRQLFRSTARAKRLQEAEREALGRVLARHARRMKGPVMKVAQHIGYAGLPLPDRVARELGALADASPPMPYADVEAVLAEELDDVGALFRYVEPVPLGTGSVGQVHRARLHDGREVAVKVLYPGIREAVRHDVRMLGLCVPLLRILVPRTPWGELVDELEAELLAETDLRREAELQRVFADGFADDPRVRVPRPLPDYVTERVLVMELAEGERMRTFATSASGAARRRATEALYAFFLRDVGSRALYADFNPGNFLFTDDTVWCLDFGCVKRWEPDLHGHIRDLVAGAVLRDAARFRPAARALNVTSDPDHFDYDRLLALFDPETYRRTGPDGAPLPWAPEDAFRLVAGFRLRADQTLQPYHLFGLRAYFSFLGLVVQLGMADDGMAMARSVLGEEESPVQTAR